MSAAELRDYREHGHELPMDLWHGYVGSDTGFDPAGHLAALDVMVGVREYVADAKRLGLRLAVASSSSRAWVLGHLERLRLDADWDAVRTRDAVARTKPAPDVYLSAVAALGVTPEEAVAFEDSMNGIAAAKDAELRCVADPNALTAGMDLSRADPRLNSLSETPLESTLALLARD